jgi:hypothetical protein
MVLLSFEVSVVVAEAAEETSRRALETVSADSRNGC